MLYGRIPVRWKLGEDFPAYSEELLANDLRPRPDLESMQLARLQAIVEHCYQQVPFYRRAFDQARFTPRHLRTLSDLQHIPLLTRQDLRDHYEELRAKNASVYQPEKCFSGGSTGEPVGFLLDRKAISIEKACVRRHWLRSGYRDGEPSVNLRGLRLRVKPGRFWITDKGENCLYLSSYHLTPETAGPYVRAFNEFSPALFNAYASSAWLLASLADEQGLTVHAPRSVVCASETLYPHQRERIETTFGARVWDWYGLTELVGNASQCQRHEGYHVSMEQGCFEVLDPDGKPVEEGATGEIVATGLNNFSMPLLRYRTGDLAEFTGEPCPCGRSSQIIKAIRGRILEYIGTPSGARLTATALNVHGNTWDNVIQFQYVQKRPDRVLLRLVRGQRYTEADEKRILRDMSARFGDEIQLGIEVVSEIPKSPRGKVALIVRELEQNQ